MEGPGRGVQNSPPPQPRPAVAMDAPARWDDGDELQSTSSLVQPGERGLPLNSPVAGGVRREEAGALGPASPPLSSTSTFEPVSGDGGGGGDQQGDAHSQYLVGKLFAARGGGSGGGYGARSGMVPPSQDAMAMDGSRHMDGSTGSGGGGGGGGVGVGVGGGIGKWGGGVSVANDHMLSPGGVHNARVEELRRHERQLHDMREYYEVELSKERKAREACMRDNSMQAERHAEQLRSERSTAELTVSDRSMQSEAFRKVRASCSILRGLRKTKEESREGRGDDCYI